MSREVFALLVQDAAAGKETAVPLVPTAPSTDAFKERKTRVTGWEHRKFTNAAREDGLVLRHWSKLTDKSTAYTFARFNKKCKILTYPDEEYDRHLTHPAWDRTETALLFDLCRRFDLRWPVIHDRFPEGRPVAQARCVDYPLALMMDDLGTKAPMPTLPPTWLIESSAGSYQAGYAFGIDDVPTKAQFIALVRALADRGLTDPGASGVVRNFRLPGSINLKQGRNNFAARLVELHPERQFTYLQLCEAYGITPTAGDTDERGWSPIAVLADDGNDDVWRWLADNGLVLSRPNSEGWAGVVCPNNEQHTDGNVEGRYNPSKRAYCCLHGHCVDLDSRTFLAWVAEQGGPAREPGIRDELLALTMSAALSKLPMTSEESEAAAAALAEVRRKEHGRIEQFGLGDHVHLDVRASSDRVVVTDGVV
jgi:hypothetical protein